MSDNRAAAHDGAVSVTHSSNLMPFEIIVSLDDSATSAAALDWAAEQSRLTGVPLRMVYTWQRSSAGAEADSPSFWEASATDARARATRWVLDMLGGGAATVRWVLDIVEGRPGPALVGSSGGASLLVLGMREQVRQQPPVAGPGSHHARTRAVAS